MLAWSTAIAALLFGSGFLFGQGRRRKFDSYLTAGSATAMDVALLRANLGALAFRAGIDAPIIEYSNVRNRFEATCVVDAADKPIEQLRSELTVTAMMTRSLLAKEFVGFSKPIAERDSDFSMIFLTLSAKPNPAGAYLRPVAEFTDGRLILK